MSYREECEKYGMFHNRITEVKSGYVYCLESTCELLNTYDKALKNIDDEIKNTIIEVFRRTHCSFNGEMYDDLSDSEILEWFHG